MVFEPELHAPSSVFSSFPAGCAVGGLALEVAGQPAVRFELYRLQCSRLHTLASYRVSRAPYFFTTSFLNSS